VGRRLVIVESRAVARTLRHQLGDAYLVLSSGSPVRRLPQHRLGIDVRRGFARDYEVPPARRRDLADLRRAVSDCDEVYLASDPDVEGEAVCWHLQEELAGRGNRPVRFRRVALREITRRGLALALGASRELDLRRVDAAQARLVLDRLVSDALARLLPPGVRSARPVARVSWIALRLVCDRERAIAGFSPPQSWDIDVRLALLPHPPFAARLVETGGRPTAITSAAEAGAVCAHLERAAFRVRSARDDSRILPPPRPFVTSSLLEAAESTLGFPVRKTGRLAERLYQGVDLGEEGPVGLINHVRTGTPRVPAEAAAAAREHVARTFGPAFVPDTARAGEPTPGGRDAAEAVRPTDVERTSESLVSALGRDELSLYSLVWHRFVASQMAPAVSDERTVEIEASAREDQPGAGTVLLRAQGSRLRFPGHLAAGVHPPEAASPLPPLAAGAPLSLVALEARVLSSEPPPRFTEGSLVRELERAGIGRPATWAGILADLETSRYVERKDARLRPTRLGLSVCDLLASRVPGLVDLARAAAVDASLDAIEDGRDNLLRTVTEFWRTFEKERGPASRPGPAVRADEGRARGEPVPGTCPECGGALVRRSGRHGPLVGCHRYPACRYIQRKEARAVGVACPECHEGEVVERPGRDGRTFYGCSRYPACRFTSSRRPVAQSCPECGRPYLLESSTKRGGRRLVCANKACQKRRTG
jgi:DNA topoisomerase-1